MSTESGYTTSTAGKQTILSYLLDRKDQAGSWREYDRYVCFNIYQNSVTINFLSVFKGFVPHFRFVPLKIYSVDDVDFDRIKNIIRNRNYRIIESTQEKDFYQDLAETLLIEKYDSIEIKRESIRND